LGWGCGHSEDKPDGHRLPTALCNGKSGTPNLYIREEYTGRVASNDAIFAEVGWSFLLVDGECRYWVSDNPMRYSDAGVPAPPPVWPELRIGTLTSEEAVSLAQRLSFPEWHQLATTTRSSSPVDHPTFQVLSNGEDVFRVENCLAPSCSPELTASAALFHLVKEAEFQLWLSGHPPEGQVRIGVVGVVPPREIPGTVTWPLAVPITDVLAAPGSIKIVDPREAGELRALRAMFQTGVPSWPPIPIRAPGSTEAAAEFFLSIRDSVVPYETAEGKVAERWQR
jgi:hypothetical protein